MWSNRELGRLLGAGYGRCAGKGDFDTGVQLVDVLIEVSFHDPVVVEPESLANRVLSDLEAAVQVAPKGGRKEESNGKDEWARLQPLHQGRSGGRLCQGEPDLPAHCYFIRAPGRG